MKTLREDINTFDNWVSLDRKASAKKKYSDLAKTQEGQKQILEDASQGVALAADYLFNRYIGITAKVFWTYFLGPDSQYHQGRIKAGDDEDFASAAYSLLLGSEGTSPYNTFDSSKFSPKADIVKQFGYYYYRYLQNEAVKMNREAKMGGLGGNVKGEEEVSVVGYEDHYDNTEEASDSSFTGEVDERLALESFLKILQSTNERYYKIMRGRIQQKSIKEIAKEMEAQPQVIRKHLRKIHQMYKDFIG